MLNVVTLGDVHLGRQFIGTPLDRRGEREAMQWRDLALSLVQPCDVHITMGDLFDKPIVPYDVILKAANLYRVAAGEDAERSYLVIAGNHDRLREVGRACALDVFTELLSDVPNVIVVKDEPFPLVSLVVIPWQPFVTADQYVEEWADIITGCKTAYGHWDVVAFGEKTQNLLPAAALKALGVETAYTGHDHLPGELEIDGLRVIKTGSMQPYSHGEDPGQTLYRTVTVDQLDEPELKDFCVRVRVTRGDPIPVPINCLQWSVQVVNAEASDDEPTDVTLADFDFQTILAASFEECEVPQPTREVVIAQLEESPNA